MQYLLDLVALGKDARCAAVPGGSFCRLAQPVAVAFALWIALNQGSWPNCWHVLIYCNYCSLATPLGAVACAWRGWGRRCQFMLMKIFYNKGLFPYLSSSLDHKEEDATSIKKNIYLYDLNSFHLFALQHNKITSKEINHSQIPQYLFKKSKYIKEFYPSLTSNLQLENIIKNPNTLQNI